MNVIPDKILNDIKLAKDVLSNNDCSVVVIKYGKILKKKKNEIIISLLELIDEMGNYIYHSVIGINNLGKASALLCSHIKSSGVYSPIGTKNGVDILTSNNIPYMVDKISLKISNDFGNKSCLFEEMVNDITSPNQAYRILRPQSPKINTTLRQAVIDPVTRRDVTGDFVSDYKKDVQISLDKIFLQAKISKENDTLSKKKYNELKNNMVFIIKNYYDTIKLPVDEEFLNKNKKKLADIFGVIND